MAEELNINETKKTLEQLDREARSAAAAFKLAAATTRDLQTQTSAYIRAQNDVTSAIGKLKSPILTSIANAIANNNTITQQIVLEKQRLKQMQAEQAQATARIKAAQEAVNVKKSELSDLKGRQEIERQYEQELIQNLRAKKEAAETEQKVKQSQIDAIQRSMQLGVAQRATALRVNGFGEEVQNMTDAELTAYVDSLNQSINATDSEIKTLEERAKSQEDIEASEKKRKSELDKLNKSLEQHEDKLQILMGEEERAASATREQVKAIEELETKKPREALLGFANVLETTAKSISDLIGGVRKTQQMFGVAAGQAAKLNFGTQVQAALSFFSTSATVSAEEIKEATSAFQQEFGGVITPEAAKNIAVQAKDLGVTTSQLAVARRQFMTATMGNVGAAAAQQDQFISEFQKKGLTSKDALDAIAQNSEVFARNGTRFAASFARAAADAKKIGVDLGKIDQVGDNIIGDFEGFLEKTAELGAMGFGFDSSRLAEVAESGDTGALMNELRSQLAAQGKDLTNLRRSEQLALSQAFGIPMAELQRLAQQQTDGSGEQLTVQEKANTLLSKAVNILDKFGAILGIAAGALTGAISIATMKTALNTSLIAARMGVSGSLFGGMVDKFKSMLPGGKGATASMAEGTTGGGFFSRVKNMFSGGAAKTAAPATSAIPAATPAPSAPASPASALPGGGAMSGLSAGMKALAQGFAAFANPMVAAGVALVTAGIIGIGFALRIAAPGIEALGTVVSKALAGVAGIITAVGGVLVGIFSQLKEMSPMQLIALGGSLYAMAGGLFALGIAGLGSAVGVGLAAFAISRLVSYSGAMSLLAESTGTLATNLDKLSNVNTAQLKQVREALPDAAAVVKTAVVAAATTPTPVTTTAEPKESKVDLAPLEKKLDAVVAAIGRMSVQIDGNKVGRVIATNASTQVGVLSRS